MNRLLSFIIVPFFIINFAACSGDDNQTKTPPFTASNNNSAQAPQATETPTPTPTPNNDTSGSDEQIQDPNAISVLEVSRYFSPYLYGITQNFIKVPAQSMVVQVIIPSTNSIRGTVHIFSPDDYQDVNRWINNQHSDAIFIDPPTPLSYEIAPENITIIRSNFLSTISGSGGDEYEEYEVEYFIESHSVTDSVEFVRFYHDTRVYIRTKDID